MITSFFKPKSSKKVTPILDASASTPASTTSKVSVSAKRAFEIFGADDSSNTKRQKHGDSNADSSKEEAVQELLSYLTSSETSDGSATWKSVLAKHFGTPSFARLAKFVVAQRQSHTIFPPPQDTFAALNWTPFEQVKVVIVGQDPYHGPDQAHGLCFSVRRGIKTPPSLRNIYKELIQDDEIPNFTTWPTHGNLERWAKQGVLMINTVLTVKSGEPNSHKNKGWELVTDEIIRAVDRRAKEEHRRGKGGGVVFLLWGKPATEKCQTALGVSNLLANDISSPTNKSHRKIFCSSHPSPLGASKTNTPFTGSKCFSLTNKALVEDFGYDRGIDWRVDGDLPP